MLTERNYVPKQGASACSDPVVAGKPTWPAFRDGYDPEETTWKRHPRPGGRLGELGPRPVQQKAVGSVPGWGAYKRHRCFCFSLSNQ